MKKGFFFSVGLVVVSVIVMTSALIALHRAKQPLQEPIGRKQFDIINLYQRGEEAKFFIEQSAKYAAGDAVISLAHLGGFATEPVCGSYLGYNLWQSDGRTCYPEFGKAFARLFQPLLGSRITENAESLPVSYAVSLLNKNPLTLLSQSSAPLVICIEGRLEAKSEQPITFPQVIPVSDKGIIPDIYNKHGQSIRIAVLNYPIVDEALIAGTIAKESAGNSNAVSATGCAGLMQFCYTTATDFKSIFGTLTPCSCYGNLCKTAPQCNTQNDGRFNPELSIKASVQYYSNLLRAYQKYTSHVEFAIAAYNAGPGVINKAIAATGKSDPFWQEVSASLKPEFITYFSQNADRVNKVDEIRNHVARVMEYRQQYKLLAYTGMAQAYEQAAKEDTHTCCICELCGTRCRLEAVPTSVSCGPYSLGKGENCDMGFCKPPSQSPGNYEFIPVFKTTINYDLDEYSEIIDAVKSRLVPQVAGISAGARLDEAVKVAAAALSAGDFKWSYGSDCDSGSDKVLNRFV
ncbi:MAG: transglycosylase SLT domain-containing protein, partial [Candidatus Woesearchaeota archaeon]